MNFVLLADYNQRMNASFYKAASQLSSEQLREDRGAFFGSILGTLNHILVGDIVWLKRFADHPIRLQALDAIRCIETPKELYEVLYPELEDLANARAAMDAIIKDFAREITDEMLLSTLYYKNIQGQVHAKNMACLMQHFFNHQTHHRGQVSTLLYQAGIDVGVTDLLIDIPEEKLL